MLTGNPVRQNILELAKTRQKSDGQFTLLVLGGSQGAHALNTLVTEALCEHGPESPGRIAVIHQTGQKDANWVEERYRTAGITATVAPFFTDMAMVYGAADLLVSRAGATTLTELAVLGKPAILVPYPYAADDHQQKNGMYYVAGGGALQYAEKDLTGKALAEVLGQLVGDPQRLAAMGTAMRERAIIDAADNIVDVCIRAARGESSLASGFSGRRGE